jgi:hypothetical protein
VRTIEKATFALLATCFGISILPLVLTAVVWAPPLILFGHAAERPTWRQLASATAELLLYWLIVFTSGFSAWIALVFVGPVLAMISAIAGTVLWISLVGIPGPASGSKLASLGCIFTLVSNVTAVGASVVALVYTLG